MLTFNFNPFPELQTTRLKLRRLKASDAVDIIALRGNPIIMEFIPRPLVQSHAEALEFIEMINTKIDNMEGINWAITLHDSDKVIGMIGQYRLKPEHHRAEIGYMLLGEFTGQGIAGEAVHAVLDYSFSVMKLHSVEAVIIPANLASASVLEKNGFVCEGRFKENEYHNGSFHDTMIYSILSRNFNKQYS
ncbi:MAG TPA: GNAT family N-acetyltransferase [Flavobacterium sp.]|jgi:ribosomal-protein-alanine N-acetyltransferase